MTAFGIQAHLAAALTIPIPVGELTTPTRHPDKPRATAGNEPPPLTFAAMGEKITTANWQYTVVSVERPIRLGTTPASTGGYLIVHVTVTKLHVRRRSTEPHFGIGQPARGEAAKPPLDRAACFDCGSPIKISARRCSRRRRVDIFLGARRHQHSEFL